MPVKAIVHEIMTVMGRYESTLPVHGDRNCTHSRLASRMPLLHPPLVAMRNSPKVISCPAERGNEHLLEISFINQDLPESVLPSLSRGLPHGGSTDSQQWNLKAIKQITAEISILNGGTIHITNKIIAARILIQ